MTSTLKSIRFPFAPGVESIRVAARSVEPDPAAPAGTAMAGLGSPSIDDGPARHDDDGLAPRPADHPTHRTPVRVP